MTENATFRRKASVVRGGALALGLSVCMVVGSGIVGCGIVVSSAAAQVGSDQSHSANELIRTVIANELRRSAEDSSRWTYEVLTNVDGQQRVKKVVEMRDGSVERLLAVNGHSLNSQEDKTESKRIANFVKSPEEQKKARLAQKKDEAQCVEFLKKIPDVFLFSDGGQQGEVRRLTFRPNPNFQPRSWQDRVFHALEGEILVSSHDLRLAAMRGRLLEDVKFGGGLLGYLQSGGEFHLERRDIGDGHWEITNLEVNMIGKALLFKSLSVQHKEAKSSFRRVSDNLTARDAAEELNANVVLASRQQ